MRIKKTKKDIKDEGRKKNEKGRERIIKMKKTRKDKIGRKKVKK